MLDDQVDALHARRRATPRSTSTGWRSAAGASAATSPRSPCCAARTSSTPPSPAHRSPSGALYDTHYTERYLGDPARAAGGLRAPTRCSRTPLRRPSPRPLLLIHGLADDNVVAAHTLRLSSALLAAGRPHEVLPLSGVTHMTPQEEVAENLLLHQLDFLKRSLGLARG